MLFHLFNTLRERVPGANVFRYVSTRVGLATLTSLLITFVVAPWFIRRARERQLGEVIRDDGPASHKSKVGTPTMGGALIIMALVAATLLWCDLGSTLVWLARTTRATRPRRWRWRWPPACRSRRPRALWRRRCCRPTDRR